MGAVHPYKTIELGETLERLVVMFAGEPERHRLERKTRHRVVFTAKIDCRTFRSRLDRLSRSSCLPERRMHQRSPPQAGNRNGTWFPLVRLSCGCATACSSHRRSTSTVGDGVGIHIGIAYPSSAAYYRSTAAPRRPSGAPRRPEGYSVCVVYKPVVDDLIESRIEP